MRRTTEEIIRDLLSGQLDVADVQVSEVVTVDKIDKSGDEPKLVETRTFINGILDQVIKH